MSGFSNPIIGGGGALVYPSIHSPGFVPDPLQGWSIDKNGNAYFETITIGGGVVRVTFAGTAPADPNTGDVWFDLDAGAQPNVWNGSGWTSYSWGTSSIADNAITTALIAASAVGTTEIASGAVTNALLAAAAVATANIEAGAVTTTQIAAAAGILGSQLSASAGITGTQLSAGTITGTQLNASVTARSLGGITTTIAGSAPGSPVTGDIWIDSASGYQLQQWSGSAWVAVTFTGSDVLSAGSVTATQIANATITATQLASSVTARSLGGITTTIAGTAPGSPVAGDIWINSASGYQINQYSGSAWVAVTWTATDVIAAGTVSASLITAATITGSLIAAGTITASNIAAGTITASNIAANTITASQIAAVTITAAQIASGTITATQIAAATITGSLIAASTITGGNIAAGTVTASNIQAGTITAAQIASGTITTSLIAANAITAGLLAAGIVYAGIVDGTTIEAGQYIVSGPGGVFVYSGTPALGNLIGSWATSAGVDTPGNSYPAGLNVSQGALQGMLLTSPTITGALIQSSSIASSSLTAAAISGGTMTQTAITFNNAGGTLLCYATTTTTVTESTAGAGQWTVPAGITSVQAVLTAGAASGSGGTTTAGGEGGGGAETAEEPAYSVTPGDVISYVVGAGGAAVSTGNAGNSGQQTTFDGTNIVANPGLAGSNNGTGGLGGTGSTNSVHKSGGAGGNATSTAGAGGGGSAGTTGAGGAGANTSSGTGSAGGAAGTGGGAAGGAGGNSAAGGAAGTAPGGGGGGAGKGGTSSGLSTLPNTGGSNSYLGNGTLRNTNGSVYQNYSSGNPGGDGDQYGYWYFGGLSVLTGKTITSAYINFSNQHSWYNSGMYAVLGIETTNSGSHQGLQTTWVVEGSTNISYALSSAFFAYLQDGSGNAGITLGPAGAVGEAGNLDYYGYFEGGVGSATLYVYYTSGSAESSGAGATGQIKLTYTNASTLICAVSPASGSDSASNAYAAGVTGPITAIEPGSSPAVAETWHAPTTTGFTTSSGFQQVKYRLLPDGDVEITGIMVASSAYTAGTTIFTFPAGYRPVTSNAVPPINIAASGVFSSAWGNITTAGVFSLSANVANAGTVVLATRFRLVA